MYFTVWENLGICIHILLRGEAVDVLMQDASAWEAVEHKAFAVLQNPLLGTPVTTLSRDPGWTS